MPSSAQNLVATLLLLQLAVTPCPAGSAASPEALKPDASSLVADAAQNQAWTAVEELIEGGSEVNAAQADGMTALHWACHWKSFDAVRMLINAGADANAQTRYGVSPLCVACESGNSDIVLRLLVADADINHTMPGKVTMLMLAARTGHPEPVKLLLADGARLELAEAGGQTALMWAAAAGHADAVDILLKMGADPMRTSHQGFSALFFAARQGRLGVVRRIIEHGVDVNATINPKSRGERSPRKGMSALMLALESGHFELAAYLVENGADPNDMRSGFTPLHAVSWVRKTGRGDNPQGDPSPRGSGHMTSLQFVRRMTELGADVNARLEDGKTGRAVLNLKSATPLLMASKTADVALMELMLELGANPAINNSDGSTPLMAAAGVGVLAVGEEAGTEPEVIAAMQLLLDEGVDINAKDANGETAVHGAAYRNYPLAIDFLAAHGADPAVWNHKNKFDATPFEIAQGKRPGSLKPSPETIAALKRALQHSSDTTSPSSASTATATAAE